MNWEQRVLEGSWGDYPEAVEALIRQQMQTWPALREAVEALERAQLRNFVVKNSEVQTQYNPKRIISTSAKVDAQTISKRPCFLCVENLPPEERGIPFQRDFMTLCNPFPILPGHLVVASRSHTPQTIQGNFLSFLELTRSLGEGWFTLYNGPRCGASAPDHLHFQACRYEKLPIMADLARWLHFFLLDTQPVNTFIMEGHRLNSLVGRGPDIDAIADWFDQVMRSLSAVTRSEEEEPMINVVAIYEQEEWAIVCYPRSRHRPSCYDAEGDARFTVSPAAIDLSGLLIVPQEDHFQRINQKDIERIYAEVTLDHPRFQELTDHLMKNQNAKH
jgi:ATP adenylyltransferase/5',5'''-P-1,P-4-tetraphosphate phosphorylase II